MLPIIVVGDRTTHGGTVVGASASSDTHGKRWARVGDHVTCPRCRGVHAIVEGDSTLIDDGMAVAYHGCKVSCGATLIASQVFTVRDEASGASGSGAESSSAQASLWPAGFGSIGGGLAAGYEDQENEAQTGGHQARFRGRFRLIDAETGAAVAARKARVRSTGGQHLEITTDADGFTPWIDRDKAEALAFDLID